MNVPIETRRITAPKTIISSRLQTANLQEPEHVNNVLNLLSKVLKEGVAGDVVELGCYRGHTSMHIRRFLDHAKSKKVFHVYDSFEGLPERVLMDNFRAGNELHAGDFKVRPEVLVENFEAAGLELPEIHEGWFSDAQYPEEICFAFLDGDFYTSISDSLNGIYDKLSPGAIVVIDDYGGFETMGVQRATRDFLRGKPERRTVVVQSGQGYFVKKGI